VLLSIANLADAASKEEIDAEVRAALVAFKQQASAGHELSQKASGMLVFPNVVKGSVIVGGEFGDGALLIDGKTVGYYNIAAASIGLQLGAQARSEVILFMTEKALKDFQKSAGWKVGVDGSVAFATLGAGGSTDSETARQPVIGFIFSNKGLMYNLTFESSKVSGVEK
jgi:lipid-binding SYLF domain-containing protein